MPPATSQPSTTPAAPGSTPPAAPDPGGTTQPPAAPAAPAPASSDIDLTKLTGEQLAKVLENQELWKQPRIAELLESQRKLKESETAATKAENDKLVADKKFEELSQKQATTITDLQTQIQTMQINQSLTNQLVKENVVDLDGALKLIDRSKISVDDNGNVVGAEDALASLKTERTYLFTPGESTPPAQPSVGNPSNPATPPSGSGQFRFKESQLTAEFYTANKAAIDEAGRLGLIEPDGPPQS